MLFLDPLADLLTCLNSKISFEKKMLSEIFYHYTCSNYKIAYHEETFQHIFTRATEHMGTSNLTGKHIENTKQSAISDQLLQCNSHIIFDDFGI